jgi:hypothetical protein
MIIVSKGSMEDVGMAIVNALVGCSDYRGKPYMLKTIDPDLLQRAAMAALVIASGEIIWPAGTPPLEKEPDERLPILTTVYPTRRS